LKKEIFISIIVPIYNRAHAIQETLDSLMKQEYAKWECIVVDDCSTDDSTKIISSYCKRDSKFKLFRRPKELLKGANSCRNIGMNEAIGDYLIFLDSDDLLKKDCLALRLEAFQKYSEFGFLIFQSELFNKKPGDLGKIPNVLAKSVDDLSRFISYDYPWNISAGIFRKSFLEDTKISWDERFTCHQDIEFYVHLLTLKPRYKKINGVPDVYIRMGSDDKVSNGTMVGSHLKSKLFLLSNIKKYLNDSGLLTKELKHRLYGLAIHYAQLFYELDRMDLIKQTAKILATSYYLFLGDLRHHIEQRKGHGALRKLSRIVSQMSGVQKRIKYAGMQEATLAKYTIEEEKYHALKVVHISTYELGGAGLAAARLHKGLQNLYVPSFFLTLKKNTLRDQAVVNFKNPKPTFVQKVWNRFFRVSVNIKNQKKLKDFNGEHEGFSFPNSDYKLHEHPLVKEAAIIHLHWVAGFVDYISFFKHVKKPIVWTLHDMNPFQGGFHYKEDEDRNKSIFGGVDTEVKYLKNESLKNATIKKIVSPSNWMKVEAQQSELMKHLQHCQIYNGVDTSIFTIQDQQDLRIQLNLPLEDVIVLFASENVNNRRKNFEMLVKAFKRLNNAHLDLTLVAIGAIPEERIENIHYVGSITNELDMARLYAAADVFVLPSREDNLPNVMLESLLCGTPVIGTPVGGIKEVVHNGVNGYLSKDVSVKALYEAIQLFLDTRRKFNRNAIRKNAMELFDVTRQAEEYISLYESILKDNKNSVIE
jgi:glycosyltransferase involved in cell wall biosynthesis